MSPYDAVVVGGGIVGAHCALHLARAGCSDVLILERDAPASKASGRAAGNLTTYHHERFGTEASRFSREYYEGLADRRDEFELHREDCYTIAYTREGAENLRRERESLTIEAERLDAADLAAREPCFDVADVEAALRFPDAAYTDPRQLTLAVHADAREAGAELRTEAVTDLVPGTGQIEVRTTAAAYDAEAVVVAAGAWSDRVLGFAGVDVALKPRTSQIAILEPPADLEMPIWGSPDHSVYGRPTPDGRVLFGGGTSTPISDLEGFRPRAHVPFLGEVATDAPAVVPALAAATLRDDRAGRVSATPDRRPHVGETAIDGLYVCAGFNGEGISNGPIGARLLADLVVDAAPLLDPSPFEPDRYDGDVSFEISDAVEWWTDR